MKEINKISTKKQLMDVTVMCTFNPYDDDGDDDDDDDDEDDDDDDDGDDDETLLNAPY